MANISRIYIVGFKPKYININHNPPHKGMDGNPI
jgi:hypothetical protein